MKGRIFSDESRWLRWKACPRAAGFGPTQQECVSMCSEMTISKHYSCTIFLLGVALPSGLCLFVWPHVGNDRERTLQEASREAMNLAKAFEEQVRSIIAQADYDMAIPNRPAKNKALTVRSSPRFWNIHKKTLRDSKSASPMTRACSL